ncbi:MAG TPA: LppX_LprAFG lipoprotein [Nocardioides sp.]|nr:LppX_LprAFG lipoprotein [Nocardioides sp.]
MTLPVRRTLAAAAATATLFALAGCNGDDSSADKASDQPASSSSATGESSPDASDAGPSDGADAPAAGTEMSGAEFAGVLKKALEQATTAHLTMDLGGTLGFGEGDVDYTTSPPEMAMTLSMPTLGGDVEARLVDGAMYLKSPTMGDKWISLPLDDESSPLGALGGQLDVKKQMETFAAAVTSATYDGAEDVDGESLDHYTATVDAQKMIQDLPSAAVGQAQLPDTLTQEWWLDQDGYIRKFSSDFGQTATTMTMSDWGADVNIEAPPTDEVTSLPGMGGAGA